MPTPDESHPVNFARPMPNWQPLVEYRRNGVAENTVHGAVSWVSGRKLIHSFGGNVEVYGRSMVKPLMMKVFAREFARDLTGEQQAISVASHNGDTEHVRVARSILREGEWGLMQAPHDVPLVQFGRQVRRPRRWYHCCSGEHAAILKGCRLKGWSRVGYVWPHHPFFQEYLDYLRGVLAPDWTNGVIAKDGCGLPTVSMTVTDLARLFANLVTEKDQDWIWSAMTKHPDLIGGFNRLDSTILKAGNGRVVAKEGADGLLGLAIEHPEYPEGLGVVVKIAHGWNPQATWYIARYILGVLGLDFRNPYKLRRQKAFIVPEVIPPHLRDRMAAIVPWDSWDPDIDRWEFDPDEFTSLRTGVTS
ncbi:MAG TPA: asparaginase [Thermoanaerobaculia bacterium]|nr:asparaginase [Thermoanaerobaculia bacterium]